jgi:hypothetical protein
MKFQTFWDGPRPSLNTVAGQVSVVEVASAAAHERPLVSTLVISQGGIPGVRLGGSFLPLIDDGPSVAVGRAVTGIAV